MATLPLQSCRMLGLRSNSRRARDDLFAFLVHGDRSGFGAAVEADTAARTTFARVVRRVRAVGVEPGLKFQALRWTGLHTQGTALAFFSADLHAALRH